MKQKILTILRRDPQITKRDLADRLNTTEKKLEVELEKLRKNGEILGWAAVLNSNKLVQKEVTAIVEIRVTPQRGFGFDGIANRIAKFPEVIDLHLISGSHDLHAIVRGKNLHEVSGFVTKKVSTLEGVVGTTTHFLLKTYKSGGLSFEEKTEDERIKVTA